MFGDPRITSGHAHVTTHVPDNIVHSGRLGHEMKVSYPQKVVTNRPGRPILHVAQTPSIHGKSPNSAEHQASSSSHFFCREGRFVYADGKTIGHAEHNTGSVRPAKGELRFGHFQSFGSVSRGSWKGKFINVCLGLLCVSGEVLHHLDPTDFFLVVVGNSPAIAFYIIAPGARPAEKNDGNLGVFLIESFYKLLRKYFSLFPATRADAATAIQQHHEINFPM